MRNLLALAAAAVITFGVVGWYLDWYKFTSAKTVDGHRTVDINFDTKKIVSDVKQKTREGEDKLGDAIESKVTTEVTKKVDAVTGEAINQLPGQ